MAGESIFADGLDPTILDGDTGVKTISNRFTVSEARPCVAGRIYVRSGGLPATALWQLWNEDTTTKLAELDMNAELVSPTEGQFSDWVSLSVPVDLSPGVSYLVAQHLSGAPGYEFTDGVPATFPVGTAPLSATMGVYQNGGGSGTMPTSEYGAYFFADLQLGDNDTGVAGSGTSVGVAATQSTGRKVAAAAGSSAAAASGQATAGKVAKAASASTAVASGTATAAKASAVTAISSAVVSATAAVSKVAKAGSASTALATTSATAVKAAHAAAASSAIATVTATVKRVVKVTAVCSAMAGTEYAAQSAPPVTFTARAPRGRWAARAPRGRWQARAPRGG